MKKIPRHVSPAFLAAFFTLLLAAPGARPLRAVDHFSLELLRDGIYAYDRGDFAGATRSLRLACFGMLDEPKPLGACLARLALAQDKASDVDGFHETFVRLVEVEDRFQGYSQSDLPAEIRTALEQRVLARIPAPTLESSPPAFRAARKPAAGPASAPASAPTSAPAQTQIPAKEKPAPAAAASPKAPADRAGGQSIQRAPAGMPPGPRSLSNEEKEKLESVRKALGETGKGKELRQTFQTAREVADAHPDAVDAQRLAGEAAYRLSLWSDAAAYLQKNGALPDSEPELLFYLAVSLYESRDTAGAAAALRRSLPNLQRSPYVDAYTRKILGQ